MLVLGSGNGAWRAFCGLGVYGLKGDNSENEERYE